ncbi:MAG TPA: low temperature requirement protein A [Jiangellaceae bacterium]
MVRRPLRLQANDSDASVTPLELFLDLVFVFALTQVTAFMADDLSGTGLLRGLLIVGLLWWSWIGYAWLGNIVRADEGPVRLVLLAAMGTMFVIALTIPEAFTDLPGGLFGPVVLAACYFIFRALHLALFWIISRDDPALRGQLVRFVPSVLGGTMLLLAASRFEGTTQTLLWCAALLADYGGTFLGGARGWRLRSAAHFAERHGLILIIALGESIVAIGVGVAAEPISWPIIAGSALGLTLSAALWWIYFDVSSLQGEHALAIEPEATRAKLARDAYTFWHAPMIVGIVLISLGLKKVLEYVSDSSHYELTDPLTGVGLYALFGGAVAYLVGQVGFKWRTVHNLTLDRLVAAGATVVLVPLATQVPALVALGVVTVVLVTLVVYESVRYAEHRHHVRHEIHTHRATEAEAQRAS